MRCLIVILVSLVGIFTTIAHAKLRMVYIIHSNGETTPYSTYPTDPHASFSYNRHGLDALTWTGIKQMYNHGVLLGNTYKELLAKEGSYRPYNLEANSSSTPRSIMSGQAFLAGFFPPANTNFLPIKWQPIPISPVPFSTDYNIPLYSCPYYIRDMNKYYATPPTDIVEMLSRDQEMVDAIKSNSGLKSVNIKTITDLLELIKIQQKWNLAPPKWFKQEYLVKSHEYSARLFKLLAETRLMKRMSGGLLISRIMNEMERFSAGDTLKRINIYSGHDTTINALHRVLDLDTQLPDVPDYGATFVFEYHSDNEVKLKYYRHAGDSNPIPVSFSNCSAPCKFDQLREIVQAVWVHDPFGYCKL